MNKIKKIVKIYLLLLIVLIGLTSFFLPAENMQIRVYAHLKVYALQVNVNNGTYKITGDAEMIGKSAGEAVFMMTLKGDSIQLKQNDVIKGTYI